MGLFRRSKTRPNVHAPASTAPETPRGPTPGLPGPCPTCGGPGYLDHIDLVSRIQRQHCRACGHEWEESIAPEREPSFFEQEVEGIELPPRA